MNAQLNSHVKERNYDNLMTFLISGQYDVNQMSEELEGHTALHLACKASHYVRGSSILVSITFVVFAVSRRKTVYCLYFMINQTHTEGPSQASKVGGCMVGDCNPLD